MNDIIKKANGNDINSNEDLQKATYESNGEPILIELERNGEIFEKKLLPFIIQQEHICSVHGYETAVRVSEQ